MLAWWCEILPVFVVRWIALRTCERLLTAGLVPVVMARPDVLIRVPKPAAKEPK